MKPLKALRLPGVLLSGLLLPAVGCDEAPSTPTPGEATGSPTATAPGDRATPRPGAGYAANDRERPAARPVTAGDPVSVDLLPPIAVEYRPRRRMNVDQLSDAVRRVSGGIGWTDNRGQDIFENLSATLGKPDYIQRTTEELEPTVLFQKFLDDAARDVCSRMLSADLASWERERAIASGEAEADPADPVPERILLRHVGPEDTIADAPDAVDANLRHLVAWFHNREVTDEGSLSHLKWLVESAAFVTGEPTQSWLGVCGVLFTHPDFYTY